jgi:hypothetical protein
MSAPTSAEVALRRAGSIIFCSLHAIFSRLLGMEAAHVGQRAKQEAIAALE